MQVLLENAISPGTIIFLKGFFSSTRAINSVCTCACAKPFPKIVPMAKLNQACKCMGVIQISSRSLPQDLSLMRSILGVHYAPSMMSQGKTPGSFQLLWGQFTWKDPLKCQFTVFEGVFPGEMPPQKLERPRGVLLGDLSLRHH